MKTYYVYEIYECKSKKDLRTHRHCYDIVMTQDEITEYLKILNKHLKEYIYSVCKCKVNL